MRRKLAALFPLLLVGWFAIHHAAAETPTRSPNPTPTPSLTPNLSPSLTPNPSPSPTPTSRILSRAREEVSRGVSYDPRWYGMSYPNGDIDPNIGVCTDVVIRGYRAAGIDFQKLVHEDVLRAPEAYATWVKTPDSTIDHRRVGPLMVYLQRHAQRLSTTDMTTFHAGDIVVIAFNACPACSPQHIAVVSDKTNARGVPLLIHNMGPTPREDDTLEAWTLLGHYRI